MQSETARIVFVMPRCRHDHVRAAHKQAYSLRRAGYEVILVVKEQIVDEYLGMQVVAACAQFESILRPILNLPSLSRQVRKLQGDVYVLRNPDTIPLAFVLWFTGKKVVYDTHEDFSKRPLIHDAVPRWWRPSIARLISLLEKILARTASAVLVTQEQQVDSLGGRTLFQPNAPLTTGPIIEAAKRSKISKSHNELSLLYVGEMTGLRGMFTMLELIERINQQIACRLDLVGWMSPHELEEQAKRHSGWRFVNFHGKVSHADSLAHIRQADIGLAILERVADYPTCSVTKLFEYMHGGIAFIASDFPAWRVATERGSPGIYVDPSSLDDIVSATLKLASDRELRRRMGELGKHYVETEFRWEQTSEPFLSLVNGLLHGERVLDARLQ